MASNFDWNANVNDISLENICTNNSVCYYYKVQFKCSADIYLAEEVYSHGDMVLVTCERGYHIGFIDHEVESSAISNPEEAAQLKKIVGQLRDEDGSVRDMLREKISAETYALLQCKLHTKGRKLELYSEIMSTEFQFDRNRLMVYIKKYEDVSVCRLVRKLYEMFKVRIKILEVDDTQTLYNMALKYHEISKLNIPFDEIFNVDRGSTASPSLLVAPAITAATPAAAHHSAGHPIMPRQPQSSHHNSRNSTRNENLPMYSHHFTGAGAGAGTAAYDAPYRSSSSSSSSISTSYFPYSSSSSSSQTVSSRQVPSQQRSAYPRHQQPQLQQQRHSAPALESSHHNLHHTPLISPRSQSFSSQSIDWLTYELQGGRTSPDESKTTMWPSSSYPSSSSRTSFHHHPHHQHPHHYHHHHNHPSHSRLHRNEDSLYSHVYNPAPEQFHSANDLSLSSSSEALPSNSSNYDLSTQPTPPSYTHYSNFSSNSINDKSTFSFELSHSNVGPLFPYPF